MSHDPVIKIDSLTKLRMEKNKLETYCTYQEKLIGLKIDYFRKNYSDVLSDSLLPYDKATNIRANNILDSVNNLISILLPEVFKGKFLPGIVLKLIEIMSIWTFRKG